MSEGVRVHSQSFELRAERARRILPPIVADHPVFFAKFFNYKPKGEAGQLDKMFALFRDQVLSQALRYGHIRTDVEATLSTMQDQTRHCRATRSDGLVSARAIEG